MRKVSLDHLLWGHSCGGALASRVLGENAF